VNVEPDYVGVLLQIEKHQSAYSDIRPTHSVDVRSVERHASLKRAYSVQ